jgi:hypothetical protein
MLKVFNNQNKTNGGGYAAFACPIAFKTSSSFGRNTLSD